MLEDKLDKSVVMMKKGNEISMHWNRFAYEVNSNVWQCPLALVDSLSQGYDHSVNGVAMARKHESESSADIERP